MEENKILFQVSPIVVEAIKNAEIVIDYIAEMGIMFDSKDIEIITAAKNAVEQNQWTQEIENNFWVAYRNLTALIQPVDIDSLLSMREMYIKEPTFLDKLFKRKFKVNLAYKTVRFYTAFALITMLVMLLVHMYFSVGTVRLSRIQSINSKLIEVQQQISEINNLTDNTSTYVTQKKESLMSELAQYNTEKQSNISLLAKWVNSAKIYFGIDYVSQENKNSQKFAMTTDIIDIPGTPQEELRYNIEIIQQAQNYIFILGLYILPLFYGLLGSITYVLRDLSNKIQKKQYKKDNNISHVLRLILGIIAGLAVGVFWGDLKNQDSLSVISSLGPLIIAFLAGLTVEYVFTAIERLVMSFLDKTSSK